MPRSSHQTKKRKEAKFQREDQMDAVTLQWKKDYAVFLKAADFSYQKISDCLGVTRWMVKTWFQAETMQKRVIEVQADMVKNAISFLQDATVELVQHMLDIARDSGVDAQTRLKAIVEGLDRAGMSKVNKSESAVTSTTRDEVALTDPEGLIARIKGAPIETQTQIAELIEGVEQLLADAAEEAGK